MASGRPSNAVSRMRNCCHYYPVQMRSHRPTRPGRPGLRGQTLIILYSLPIMGDVASFVALRCPIAGGQAIHLISWGMRTDHRWDAARRRAYEGARVRKYQNAREGGSPTPFGWRIGGDADARPGRLAPSHLQSGGRGSAPCPPAIGVEVRLRIAVVGGPSEEPENHPPAPQSSITGRRRRQEACQPE